MKLRVTIVALSVLMLVGHAFRGEAVLAAMWFASFAINAVVLVADIRVARAVKPVEAERGAAQ
ncbi:hypothetical protein JOL79_11505 [Microbispora sp. RL4-1S]|uniref:Uncharacterized protein n=1 Tax=Microbispora oryzae TaxID=2806554 RepID=A0A941AHT3_9ACTN|nr:hypothetical protein [Microbispora oryzae]MBP2704440.1 hypothetical protein [Microbispora oryzae]